LGEKMLGDKGVEWSEGEKRFMWIMADAISNGKWNDAKHRKNGHGNVTWKDARRLNKILRKIYKDIQEDEDDEDDEDTPEKKELENLFLF
jgi:hypothetical protein